MSSDKIDKPYTKVLNDDYSPSNDSKEDELSKKENITDDEIDNSDDSLFYSDEDDDNDSLSTGSERESDIIYCNFECPSELLPKVIQFMRKYDIHLVCS